MKGNILLCMNPIGKESPLPVREEDLWPPGELLHLVGLSYLGDANRMVVTLTSQELNISSTKFSDDRLPPYHPDEREGHTFITPHLKNTKRYPTSSITRVRISHWGVSSVVKVWIRELVGREKRVLKIYFVEDLPRTIVELAKRAREQGFAEPGIKGLGNERRIFDKEVERQFMRAAPNASVVLKGHALSNEDFARLVR